MTNDFLLKAEQDLLNHIVAGLQSKNISIEDAKKLAKEFLVLLPVKDKEDLLQKLNRLGQTYLPAKQTYVDSVSIFTEEKREQALSEMRDYIKSGDIEAAINVAKVGNSPSVNTTGL